MAFLTFRNLVSRRAPVQEECTDSPYPLALLDLLATKFGLSRTQFGVDLGPGSGRLAQLFLRNGYTLLVSTGQMKKAAAAEISVGVVETQWAELPDALGRLSTRHLAERSVDFVISERALFAPDAAAVKAELRRILRPGGVIALITDNRVYGGGQQSEEYEDLLRRHCQTFREKQQPIDIGSKVADFFDGGQVYQDAFISAQATTLGQLSAQTSRLAIYPHAGDPERERIEAALERYFQRWANKGVLNVPVVCRVACARVEQLEPRPEPVRQTALQTTFQTARPTPSRRESESELTPQGEPVVHLR